jgi:hypothetical protein
MKLQTKLLVCLALSSCALFSQSRVRVVHASPDAPAVDIYVDGQKALEGIPFGDYSDYATVNSGQRNLQVFVGGTMTKVAEVNPNLSPGQDYSVVASGFAGGKAPALSLFLLTDTTSDPPSGWAKLRVVHASPSAPAVDVYLTGPYATLKNRAATLTSVPFGAGSAYLTVPAGQYQARVTPAGTQTIAIDSGRLPVTANAIRTVIAVDAKGGGAPLGVIVLTDRN